MEDEKKLLITCSYAALWQLKYWPLFQLNSTLTYLGEALAASGLIIITYQGEALATCGLTIFIRQFAGIGSVFSLILPSGAFGRLEIEKKIGSCTLQPNLLFQLGLN